MDPIRKAEIWARLFELSVGPLDSLVDARRAYEGLGSPLERLESFAALLNRHGRYPELARTIELALTDRAPQDIDAAVLGPVFFYLIAADGNNFDSVISRTSKLNWAVEDQVETFRAWMHEAGNELVAMYLGLHILADHPNYPGVAGVSEALEALAVQHDAPVWLRQRLAQFRTESFRLAVSIFDAMWPEGGEAALYWLSRATDLSSDSQMLKLLEGRQRPLCLEVLGVRWLRDRHDLLGIEPSTWVELAEHAEHANKIAASVESWLVVLSLSDDLAIEQAHHVATLAIESLHNFDLAERVVEASKFEPRILEYLVGKYVGDGDIESAVGWLARAERQTGYEEKERRIDGNGCFCI